MRSPTSLLDKITERYGFCAWYSASVLATFRDYGITYDEPIHVRYGDTVLSFFATWGHDERALGSSRFYGAGFDLFAAVVRRIVPLPRYEATHLACAFVALLGIAGTHRLGRVLGGPAGGFFAMVSLALTPVYYGHAFNNMKDMPFAAGYAWAVTFCCRLVLALPRPHWKDFAWAAFGIGLASCTRIGGFVLVPLVAAVMAVSILLRMRAGTPPSRALRDAGRLAVGGVGMVVGAWVVMVAPWPHALVSPFDSPVGTAKRFANYKHYTSTTLLDGKAIPSSDVPWDYIPTYIAIHLPEWVTLLAVGVAAVTIALWVGALVKPRAVPRARLLVVLAVVGPIAGAALRGSTIYDGLRHFLFIVPPIAALAGAGAADLLAALGRRSRWHAAAMVGVLALLSADQVRAMVRYHPQEHVYFNRSSGGLAKAVGRYETEYYGNTYKELLTWLLAYTQKRDGEAFISRRYLVTGCGAHDFFEENLPENFVFISRRSATKGDFFATYRRFDCQREYSRYPELYRVARDGALLAIVRDMKAKPKPRPRRVEKGGKRAKKGGRRHTARPPAKGTRSP